MNLLDVAKNYGIELLPDLNDIEELKDILTTNVLYMIREKYEEKYEKQYKIPEKEEYSKQELFEYAEKYGQVHVRIWFIENKYHESFIFSRFFYRKKHGNFGKIYKTQFWPSERFKILKITPLLYTGMPLYAQNISKYRKRFTEYW